MQECSSIDKVFLEQRLAIEIKQIKGMKTDNSLQISTGDVLATTLSQELERQDLIVFDIESH